jgi:hypothetical protein
MPAPRRPSQRELTLAHLRIAGYDGDHGAWTRLYIEHRVSYAVAKKMWDAGVAMRKAGVRRS